MPEAGGEHARYFDPNDAEAIADAMQDGVEDYVPAFAGLRDAAVARARTFTWRRTAQGVLQAYREAVAHR
jgi:glycosyltransferase involved in cell wall biosynthesis